jgi:hypothetical protein
VSPFSDAILSTYDSALMYHPSVGELPYPEWRLALADRAQKARLGDVGTMMEWLMLADGVEELNLVVTSSLIDCGQLILGANFSREHKE